MEQKVKEANDKAKTSGAKENQEGDRRKPVVAVFTPGKDFLLPYIGREFDGWETDPDFFGAMFEKKPVDFAVMISNVSVYNRTEGRDLTEEEPADSLSPLCGQEADFTQQCRAAGVNYVILRTDNVIATGMNGFPRKLVNLVYRGFYFRIKGNEAVKSAVHGIDVAKAARLACERKANEVYNCAGSIAYPIDEIADALAWRISQKRIFPLKARWARLIYGKSLYNRLTTSLTFSSRKLTEALGMGTEMNPWTDIREYLHNHVYDHDSL